MKQNRNARQILAFGEDGQRHIEAQKVAIVGLGGLGAHVAQGLAYLGVQSFLLVDDDILSETNLNRTPGAFPEDIGVSKVEIARRHILRINPLASVNVVFKNLRSREAVEAIIPCTHIFGCLDHDAPRLVLMELAAAYEIVFIDIASQIFPAKDGDPFDFGGRVVFSRPGDFCLVCADQIDLEMAKQELEDDLTQQIRKVHGYGLLNAGEAASVFSLNGVVANLAMTEFMVAVTGIREPERKLSYRGMRGIVIASKDTRKSDCFTCGYLRGKKDSANMLRYVLSKDSPSSKAQ